jgi:hypothetical protein
LVVRDGAYAHTALQKEFMKMKKFTRIGKWLIVGEAVAELMTLPTNAVLAGSGKPVVLIQSAGNQNPGCVIFKTEGDGTFYGFSTRDPGVIQSIPTINNSHIMKIMGYNAPITFLSGTPPSSFTDVFPDWNIDCNTNTMVYVWKIQY